jgi:hypothetical protein
MWLRFVVSNLLHQIAEQKLQQAASQMKQSMGKGSTASSEDPHSQHEPKTCDIVVAFALNIESCGLVDRMSQVVSTR